MALRQMTLQHLMFAILIVLVITSTITTYHQYLQVTYGSELHSPVGELPERIEAFVENSTGKSISGYAINNAGNGTIANGEWGSCNLIDALNYNLQTTMPNQYHNNLSSSIATYCWKRTQ